MSIRNLLLGVVLGPIGYLGGEAHDEAKRNKRKPRHQQDHTMRHVALGALSPVFGLFSAAKEEYDNQRNRKRRRRRW